MVRKLLVLATLLPSISMAYDININGFGNFIYGQHDQDKNDGLTYEDVTGNASVYRSSAGVSFTTSFDDNWGAKVQLIGDSNLADDVSLDIYQLTYDHSSNLKVRFGKIRSTTWMFSEVIQVSALYPWIAPPPEVYSKNPMTGLSGLMTSYGINTGSNTQLWLDAYVGNTSATLSNVTISARDVFGINTTWGNEFYSIRYSQLKAFMEGEIVTPSDNVVSGATVRSSVIVEFDLKNINFQSLGAKYDKGNILALYEQVIIESDSELYEKAEAYYMTLGYYFSDRKYLLHLTSAADTERKANAYPSSEKSVAMGFNYQLNPNIVLKSEIKKVSVDRELYEGSPLTTADDQDRSQSMNIYPDRDVNIFSLGLAAVF